MAQKTLKRQLGVLDVTAITAGIVIGAGVFVVTGIGAKYAGSLTWLAYAIGAIPVILVGLSTVYLNLMYPVEGGESYVYPTRIVSKVAGFLSGWGMWLALIGPVAITAKAFVAYVNALPSMTVQLNIIGFMGDYTGDHHSCGPLHTFGIRINGDHSMGGILQFRCSVCCCCLQVHGSLRGYLHRYRCMGRNSVVPQR